MRLADFKMRLLVFFAGALRKWAGSIEPARDERAQREDREDRVDDRVAVAPAESRREASASGPPEHWARLVATSPPDHWLDLIREKAPHLLPAYENGSVFATNDETPLDGPIGQPENTGLDRETRGYSSSDNETAERSTQRAQSQRWTKRAADSGPQVNGAKWLNRLRFRPPKQRPNIGQDEPFVYPAANEAKKTAEYGVFLHDSSRAAVGRESQLAQSDRHDQRREPVPERQSDRKATSKIVSGTDNSDNEENATAERRRHLATGTAAEESGNTRSSAATQERRRQYEHSHEYGIGLTSSKAQPEQTPRTTIDDPHQPRASKIVPTIFVERAETNSSRARARSAADSTPETESLNRRPRFRELNRELTGDLANSQDTKFAEPHGEVPLGSRAVRQLNAERAVAAANRNEAASERKMSLAYETPPRNARLVAAERSRDAATARIANTHMAQSQSARAVPNNASSNAATRNVEHPRHRFASTDFATPALVESSESMWPTLPPARNFELTDDLAALEREAETLRRLDREQRGILWNA